jgi:hypothetical protein
VASRQLPVITQTVFSATRSWSPGDFFGGEFLFVILPKIF